MPFLEITRTISGLELTWTLLGICALFLHGILLREALIDREAVREIGETRRRLIIVNANIRNEAARAFKQAIFIVIGVFAMAVPSNPTSNGTTALVVGFGLIFVECLLVWLAYADYRDRRNLVEETEAGR